jgi:hypothetical protein
LNIFFVAKKVTDKKKEKKSHEKVSSEKDEKSLKAWRKSLKTDEKA